jgi:hypothetical protein
MSDGGGWLVGAALIGAIGLISLAWGWWFGPWATVVVGLVAVLHALRPRLGYSVLDGSHADVRWGWWLWLSASLWLLLVGLLAAIGATVDRLEGVATRRGQEP